VGYPRAGAHYPRSTGEFLAWFGTDEDCLDYLEWLRWPGGFACPRCGHSGGWRLADGRVECGGCGRRTSVTAGTIFDKTRTPLTVWFHACWLFTTAKDGISAQHLQRALEIGSCQTAWAMLHRLRSALVRPGRDRLAGTAEVDETFIGGEEHGLRGGRQPGRKVLAGIAVEISEPKGIGRCRMAVLADASAASPGPFVTGNVEPGSRVITDGWVGYNGLAALGYAHERRNQKAAARRGEDPGELLPAVHRVSSLCKRWLLGTHQGSVEPAHLQAYLNEFAFRFNRRDSRSRGLVFFRVLELATGHDPVRYDDIRATRKPRSKPPQQRGTGHPPSLNRPAAARPWRTAEMQLPFPLRLSGYPGPRFRRGSCPAGSAASGCCGSCRLGSSGTALARRPPRRVHHRTRPADPPQLSGGGSPVTCSRSRGSAKSRKSTIWPSRIRRTWMDDAVSGRPVVVTVAFARISTITTSGSWAWYSSVTS
jgi:transposase-like protein